MKKEDVFVRIDSEEKRLRAIQILTDAGEKIWSWSALLKEDSVDFLLVDKIENDWFLAPNNDARTEITLNQLDQLLIPNYTVKEVHLTVDELREQAEKLGFELIEKKREIKVGDFGVFWDNDEPEISCFGFLTQRNDIGFKDNFHTTSWENFRHLTDEEKQQIQENW